MKRETLKQAILDLSPEEKILLMKEIGPALCDAVLSRTGAIEEMMPMCGEMMMGTMKE